MPNTSAAATSQNERWELGRILIARRYLPSLVRAARERRDGRCWAYLDAIADHLIPPLSVLVAANSTVVMTSLVDVVLSRGRHGRLTATASLVAASVCALHVVVALVTVRAPATIYRSLAGAPRMVLWKLRVWVRVLVRPERVRWSRTQRNQAGAVDVARTVV